jgi:hypothetical protein
MLTPSIQKIRAFFDRSHRNDRGAVALLCLAAVLALMMIAWTIVDAHKSTKDKIMLQGAADTAAFSHAAVEARSMNMIAYSNIAKRSIIGMHSMYPGMFFVYTIWMIDQASGCQPVTVPFPPFVWPKNPPKCWRFISNVPQWVKEAIKDHSTYSGNPFVPYAGGIIQTVADLIGWVESVLPFVDFGLSETVSGTGSSLVSGYSKTAYGRDIKALDNYQRYMMHLTPWWGWSEQLGRGWRNGATTVASFPPPPGEITTSLGSIQQVINSVNSILSMFGAAQVDLTTYVGNDNLPIKKSEWHSDPGGAFKWLCQMFVGDSGCGMSNLFAGNLDDLKSLGNESYILEHIGNALIHKQRSKKGAAKMSNVIGGATLGFATVGLQYSRLAFGSAGNPVVMNTGDINNQGDWMKFTSNLVFAYHNDPSRMDDDRTKFQYLPADYEHTVAVDDLMYKASGYWTMAKSEITFNGDGWTPDMWHPSWTARMRPVHLPGEFEESGYNMNVSYLQALPYLALSAQVASLDPSGGAGVVDAILNSVRDFVLMQMSTSAMGNSTIEGLGK